jgi:hypothetical protein
LVPCQQYTRSGSRRGRTVCDRSVAYRNLVESSPSAITTDLVIPNDANIFAFDYVFGNTGDGDWMSLLFGNELSWELTGKSALEGVVSTALIDVSDFRGTTRNLKFLLNSVGDSNMDFALQILDFWVVPLRCRHPPVSPSWF